MFYFYEHRCFFHLLGSDVDETDDDVLEDCGCDFVFVFLGKIQSVVQQTGQRAEMVEQRSPRT